MSAPTAVLSAAQHGPALISHQVAIISPSCTHYKCSSSKSGFLTAWHPLRDTPNSLALYVCFAWPVLLDRSIYTQLITVGIALGLELMRHQDGKLIPHNCEKD